MMRGIGFFLTPSQNTERAKPPAPSLVRFRGSATLENDLPDMREAEVMVGGIKKVEEGSCAGAAVEEE